MQGIEMESGLTMPLGFSLTGNLTWLDTENKDTGKDLEGQPDYKGDMKLGYDYPGLKLHANIRASYFGKTYYEAGDKGGYPLYHCYLSKGIAKDLKIFAGANNIFNNVHQDPTGF
jgi:outer membrane receptor for ferrienterochelin and colicins